jgi:hypothetical protein
MLGERGIAVTWNGTAVEFSSPDAQPPYVAAALDASERAIAAMMKPGPDGRSFLDHARERHRPLLEAVDDARTPDVDDAHWQTALRGLREFLFAGCGDEALCLGWPPDELYAVPPVWARVDLCGVALLIGDHEVVEIAADAIQINTASGATLSFYRKPQIDYALIYETHLKLVRGNYAGDSEEPWLRALEYTVGVCCRHYRVDLRLGRRWCRTPSSGRGRRGRHDTSPSGDRSPFRSRCAELLAARACPPPRCRRRVRSFS